MSKGLQPSNYSLRSARPVNLESGSESEKEITMNNHHHITHIHLEPYKGMGTVDSEMFART